VPEPVVALDDVTRSMPTLLKPAAPQPPAPASAIAVRLRVVGGLPPGEFELAAGSYVIGREPPADLVLPAPSVSRRHARLEVSTDGVTIEDLGSTNGTGIDGRSVTQRTKLILGSSLQLGEVALTVDPARRP
jgi:pSer/pThr/pTyr-binding forkhead associated (FHA) protein